ncbi:MAG TPA: hypothetical protein VF244_10435 [Acidimicrobiales bacterium]
MSGLRVEIDGLKDFQKALRAMDGESQKQLRVVFNRAADIVVDTAQPWVPRRTGAAAKTVRKASDQRSAAVKFGGPKAPYYPWLDFGGKVGRGDSIVRPFKKEGRYVYVALRKKYPEIRKALSDGLRELAESVGLGVDRG